MEPSDTPLIHLIVALVTLIISLLLWNLFSKKGRLTLPSTYVRSTIPFRTVALCYCLYLFTQLTVSLLFSSADVSKQIGASHFVILMATVALLLFSLTSQRRETIWANGSFYPHFFYGAGYWLLSYPIMTSVGQLTAAAVNLFHRAPPIEQSPVQLLRHTTNHPVLFIASALILVFVIPVAEELLFRGLFQSWLRRYVSREWAIIASALVFTSFHFSSELGASNLVILNSLFILALFLGFVYERYQTLFAPIGLHVTFNAIHVTLIAISEHAL